MKRKILLATLALSMATSSATQIMANTYTNESSYNLNTQKSMHQVDNLDFGVGYGIEWEDGVFAPFADMGAWVSDANYSNSGALDLGTIMAETGTRYFNLGFINAVDSTVDANGVLNWGFGGYQVLNEDYGTSNAQYQGIKQAMLDVRNQGGDVVLSIGGLNERNFFQYTTDLDVLVNTYMEIIDGFNLTRIDLDIEGGSQGYAMNTLNAQAMKIVQEKTGVEVVLTLPVLPTGLTESLGLPTVQAYLDAGVDIEVVNIMAMCYGSYYGDYAVGSIQAIDSTMNQLKDAYKKVGTSLTDEEAYNKVGITTSIGFEGSAHPIFTVDDSKLVVDYANEKGINFVSFWSINRDSQTQSNTGIYGKYEHTDVYLGFEDAVVTPEPETEEPVPPVTPEPETEEPVPPVTPEPETEEPVPPVTPEPETEEPVPPVTPEPETEEPVPPVTPEPETEEPVPPVTPEPETEEPVPPVTPEPETEEPQGDYPTWSREAEANGEYTPGYLVAYRGAIYQQVSNSVAWWCEPSTDSSVWAVVGTDSSYEAPAPTEWSREVEATGKYAPGYLVTYNGLTYKQVSNSTSWWCEPGTDSNVWAVQ